jgi:hypothetical protein
MEAVPDLYRAGTQPGPRGPLPAPEGAPRGTGGILHDRAPVAPMVLAGGSGGILHEGGLASSTCVLELRTMYGIDHVTLRPTFPACCPSHVMEPCNTIPLLG